MTIRTNASRPEPEGTVRAGYDPANELWEYINPDGTPDAAMIERVIDAIVATVQPERIILFGSAARGEMHENSDLDFLVVKKGCESARRRTTGSIYGELPVDRRPVDIVLASQAEVELNRNKPHFVIGPALKEGRTVYDVNRERRRHLAAAR